MTDREKFIIARWTYAIGVEYISDSEYTRLEEAMTESGDLKEYTNRGWSEDPCPVELLKLYNLDEYITSALFTYKTESIESLNSDELVRDRLSSVKTSTRLSFKLDGFSVRLNYYNGVLVSATTRTRSTNNSMDLTGVTRLFKNTIPIMGKVLVNGELYLKNNKFNEYKELRGIISQRSGVSTAIANGDVEYLGYRCYNYYGDKITPKDNLSKYKDLEEWGFPVPKHITVNDYAGILKGVEILGRQKPYYDAPTDGVVCENDIQQYALRIGAWKEELNNSYITGYTFNRGMYGNSVLCKIKPIKVGGSKVQSEISVTNLQTIIDNDLRVGSPIVFTERSAVNSILDTDKTREYQSIYKGRYETYREEVDLREE